MSFIVSAALRFVDLAPTVRRTDAIQSFESQETVILTLTDADGAHGTGYTYTIGTGGSSIVALLTDHLLPRLMGREADGIEAIWKDLTRSVNALTVGPIVALAMAAVDTALWDLRTRRAALPLHLAAGGAHASVPVYSTEGGWLHATIDELVADAIDVKARGFRGAKVKVGKPSIAEDVERLAAVREAVGPEWDIMVDANQALTVESAIRRADAYRDIGLAWFEEPLPADDILGHSRLAARTAIPIAVGESLYSLRHFREYLQQDAAGVVQVDVARIGGITPWLKVAHLAEAYNVPVAPHFLMELHVSLACATPSGARVEYIPQLDPITTSRISIVDGQATPPNGAGLGIDWDWDEIERRTLVRSEFSA